MLVASSVLGVLSLGIVSFKRLHNSSAWLVVEAAGVVMVVVMDTVYAHLLLDPDWLLGVLASNVQSRVTHFAQLLAKC